MSNHTHKRLKTVGLVILITLLGKMLGLGRNMLIGQSFGTGFEADALATASHLPSLLFDAVFAAAVAASFIPVFSESLERHGREEADRLARSFFTVVGLAAALLAVLGMLFAPSLINLLANFDSQRAVLAARLLSIIFPSLFFTAIAFSMVGMLNSLGEFKIPAAMSTVSNGIMILYFLFFVSRFGVYGAAVAMLIGWVAQALLQVPSLVKKGFRYRPRLWHPDLKKIFRLMLPVMVGTWTVPINMAIILGFASTLYGGTSSVSLANGLYIMIAGIFVLSVTNVIFPEMSRLSASGDRHAFCGIVRDTTRTLLFLLIPMTVGLALLSTPLVRLLYEYRQFDAESTRLTASALFFMSFGMVGYGIQNMLIRVFYAEKRGKIPLLSGVVSVAVNLTLCLLLVDVMGVAGLGIASAASLLATSFVLIPATHRLLGEGFLTRTFLWALSKMGLAAVFMGLVVFVVHAVLARALGDSVLERLLLVGIPAIVGVLTYMGLAHVFRLDEIKTVFSLIRRRRKGDA